MCEIDDTFKPFGGEFIVHGGDLDVREGHWDGALVIIRFPDRDSAVRWYESAHYQRILTSAVEPFGLDGGVGRGSQTRTHR